MHAVSMETERLRCPRSEPHHRPHGFGVCFASQRSKIQHMCLHCCKVGGFNESSTCRYLFAAETMVGG